MSDHGFRIGPPSVETWLFEDGGAIPNNAILPLLVYRGAVVLPRVDPASAFESIFTANGWPAAWRYGVFPFHHFHSTAHESLGVFRGQATVRFGGEFGTDVTVRAGDAIVIPAGVGHKALEASTGFGVVGAYPAGTEPDLCRGAPEERTRCLEAILQVALPNQDPLYGAEGPLRQRWSLPSDSQSGTRGDNTEP